MGAYYESIINKPSPYPFKEKPEEPPSSADPEVAPEAKKPAAVEEPSKPTKKKPGRRSTSSTSSKSAAKEESLKKAAAEAAASSPAPSKATSPPSPSPPPATAQEKARIVFGTRLAGPDDKASHLATKKSQSTYIAGVLVPPEPPEPDNCCMSGCVNCVWELFREDMEEYTAARAEAERRLAARESSGSMDDDGGGSETNWAAESAAKENGKWNDAMFKSVPVGIREFMKIEKRLKERHEQEGTVGG